MREKDLTRLSDAEAERLARFYAEAEREIIEQINTALLRGNQTRYLKAMLENVNVILEHLRAGSRTWCEKSIPRTYVASAKFTDVQLKAAGARRMAAGFGTIHQQAAQVLAEAAYKRFDETAVTIGRRVDDIYRTLALENVRGSVTGYKTWEQVARGFREQLAEQGVTGFKDKAGRHWNMRSYSKMVARTTTMEAHLEGTKNRLLEHGYDLVVISRHPGACELCAPWEGKILSLTGKTPGYPTLQEAREAGLFHPNCRHAYGLYVDLDAESEGLESELDIGSPPTGGPGSRSSEARPAYTLMSGIVRDVVVHTIGGTRVVAPKDLDTKKQHLTVDNIRVVLTDLPDSLATLIDEIQILDIANPKDEYWEKAYNMKGFRSFATAGQGVIRYFANDYWGEEHSRSHFPESLTHESGHLLDEAMAKSQGLNVSRMSLSTEWQKAMETDYTGSGSRYVSWYAGQARSPLEDFADSVVSILNHKEWFETTFPNRTRLLREWVK